MNDRWNSMCAAALAVAAHGCAATRCGEGTTLREGACVIALEDGGLPRADASSTLSDGDAATVELRADDTLVVSSSTAPMVPGTAYCTAPVILRRDGTRAPLSGALTVTVESSDTTVIEPARAGECGPYGGFVALGPGTATARWTVARPGVTLVATQGVRVLDADLEFSSDSPATIPVGSEVSYRTTRRVLLRDGSPAIGAAPASLVARFVDGWRADPSGRIELRSFDAVTGAVVLRGVSEGAARLVGGYGPPGRVRPMRSTATLTVVRGGTLTALGPFEYADEGLRSAPQLGRLLEGDCVVVRATGTFDAGVAGMFEQDVTARAAWTVSGPGRVAADAPSRVCGAGRGEITVRACVGAVCREEVVPGYRRGDTVTLSATPSAFSLAPTGLDAFSGCAAVRVTLSYGDGSTLDVTHSPRLFWVAQGASAALFFQRSARRDGDSPCFDGHDRGRRAPYDFDVGYAYADINGPSSLRVSVR